MTIVDEERLRLAASLGLTPWEARVYLALLDLGEAKASEVAAEARVPRGRIYDILELVASAEREIVGYSSEFCVVRQAKVALPIYKTKARDGVDIRLSANITLDNLAAVQALESYVRMRHHRLGNRILTVLVVDRKRGLFVHWNPDDEDLSHGDDTGVASDEAGFSDDIRTAVIDRWKQSVEAADRYKELAPVPGGSGGPSLPAAR